MQERSQRTSVEPGGGTRLLRILVIVPIRPRRRAVWSCWFRGLRESNYRGRVAAADGGRSVRYRSRGEAKVVAGGPAEAVECVLLEEREERYHRGIVTGSTDLAHGTDEAMQAEFGLEPR